MIWFLDSYGNLTSLFHFVLSSADPHPGFRFELHRSFEQSLGAPAGADQARTTGGEAESHTELTREILVETIVDPGCFWRMNNLNIT